MFFHSEDIEEYPDLHEKMQTYSFSPKVQLKEHGFIQSLTLSEVRNRSTQYSNWSLVDSMVEEPTECIQISSEEDLISALKSVESGSLLVLKSGKYQFSTLDIYSPVKICGDWETYIELDSINIQFSSDRALELSDLKIHCRSTLIQNNFAQMMIEDCSISTDSAYSCILIPEYSSLKVQSCWFSGFTEVFKGDPHSVIRISSCKFEKVGRVLTVNSPSKLILSQNSIVSQLRDSISIRLNYSYSQLRKSNSQSLDCFDEKPSISIENNNLKLTSVSLWNDRVTHFAGEICIKENFVSKSPLQGLSLLNVSAKSIEICRNIFEKSKGTGCYLHTVKAQKTVQILTNQSYKSLKGSGIFLCSTSAYVQDNHSSGNFTNGITVKGQFGQVVVDRNSTSNNQESGMAIGDACGNIEIKHCDLSTNCLCGIEIKNIPGNKESLSVCGCNINYNNLFGISVQNARCKIYETIIKGNMCKNVYVDNKKNLAFDDKSLLSEKDQTSRQTVKHSCLIF